MDESEPKEEKNINSDSIELLVVKSKELLNYQLAAIDTYTIKVGIIITVASLFTPIAFTAFDKFKESFLWTIIFFIPIGLNFVGLFFLIWIIWPQKINFGLNFHKFDELLNGTKENAQLFEIGVNRSSYRANERILNKLKRNLANGLFLIFLSAIVLATIVLIKYLTEKICICYD